MKLALIIFGLILTACEWPQLPTPEPTATPTPEPTPEPTTVPVPFGCVPGTGNDYRVGPGQQYANISDVPLESLTAGDSVRVWYRNEPYREHVNFVTQAGTKERPIVFCGVAGSNGSLPILDGENATSRAQNGIVPAMEARGLISFHFRSSGSGTYHSMPRHIVIDGFEIRNAHMDFRTRDNTGIERTYFPNAAAVNVLRGEGITIRNCKIHGNGNGIFVAAGGDAQSLVSDVLIERNEIFGNGTTTTGVDRHHNLYVEAKNVVYQFNRIGPLRSGAGGSALKDRSAGMVIRYNRIEGGARSLDLVDAQESAWHLVALPEYRQSLVYGNLIIAGPGAGVNLIHYGGDSSLTQNYRKGQLHFFNNTLQFVRAQSQVWSGVLFDVDTPDERVIARNNIIQFRAPTDGVTPSAFAWMRNTGHLELGLNYVAPLMDDWRYGAPNPAGSITGKNNLVTSPNRLDPAFFVRDYEPAFGVAALNAEPTLFPVEFNFDGSRRCGNSIGAVARCER